MLGMGSDTFTASTFLLSMVSMSSENFFTSSIHLFDLQTGFCILVLLGRAKEKDMGLSVPGPSLL